MYLPADTSGSPNGLECGKMATEVSILSASFPCHSPFTNLPRLTHLNSERWLDTTTMAINNALYQLPRNPSCLAKHRAGFDTVLDESLPIVPITTFRLTHEYWEPG